MLEWFSHHEAIARLCDADRKNAATLYYRTKYMLGDMLDLYAEIEKEASAA